MTMKLLRFRVTDFRSVSDSGWIKTENVSALIGTNESGKTNLLLPLWKLNPAKEGDINQTADYPRKRLTEFRGKKQQPDFIEAVFETSETLAAKLSEMTGSAPEDLREVTVVRDFAGDYAVSFPGASEPRTVTAGRLHRLLDEARTEILGFAPIKKEGELGANIAAAIESARKEFPQDAESHVGKNELEQLVTALGSVSVADAAPTSTIAPRFQRVQQEVQAIRDEIARPLAEETEGVHDLVIRTSEFRLLLQLRQPGFGDLPAARDRKHETEGHRREGSGEGPDAEGSFGSSPN